MEVKKKTVKPKTASKNPGRWTIQVDRNLLEPVTEMAHARGMTVGGFGTVAIRQLLIRMQAEICISGDCKDDKNKI
jgi:hypothetical protein